MGNFSKQKGKRGENEFSAWLAQALGHGEAADPAAAPRAQVQAHGADCLCVSGLAIEVKRCETLRIAAWWAQAAVQADALGLVPVLAYRQNRKAWRFLLPAALLSIGLEGTIELDAGTFRQWLLHWVKGYPLA